MLNYTSAIVLELQEKMIQYSHQSRLQTSELHQLLRKQMNDHHVLQTCTMITGSGGIPPLPAHAQTVDTRPYIFFSIGLGTRLSFSTNWFYKLVKNSLEGKDRSLVGSHVMLTGAGRVKHWRQQFYGEI